MATRINDRNPYFSQNIKVLRTAYKMSQSELAAALAIPAHHGGAVVSGWERGDREPSLATVCRIANYFGVTTDWLLGNTSENPFTSTAYTLLTKGEQNLKQEDKDKLLQIIKTFIT